jgi:SAM-dependent methyltransferase
LNSLEDARKYAPATERNRVPILEVLQRVLPSTGTVLEVAAGTGQHAVFFAPRLTPRKWLPTDPNPILRDSIKAWCQHYPSDNLYPPLDLDVCSPIWSVERDELLDELNQFDLETYPFSAIVCINMIHIAPWEACLGLMAGAKRLLQTGGILYLYGPYKQGGRHTAPSNADFDQSLRIQNPDWGVRDLEEVVAAAAAQSLSLLETVLMPANNLSVVFQRQG